MVLIKFCTRNKFMASNASMENFPAGSNTAVYNFLSKTETRLVFSEPKWALFCKGCDIFTFIENFHGAHL